MSRDQFIISDKSYNYSFTLPGIIKGIVYDDVLINNKERFGINARFGFKLQIGSSSFIKPHTDVGIVLRRSEHYDIENVNNKMLDVGIFNSNKPENTILLNIALNAKIGFRF